uniref:ATP synthase F0 subunit 6 n=1 Tax=Cichlidarus nyanzae TaxID=608002 RepID=A0A2Z4GPH0_9PLAT|nr:ATP synthase F0 subunit 6 [Gyrodactylus nyanzae]AWW03127.1 ATP synthase F0 subunit 6 [Gyrodactylus nyanzae]
MTFNSYINYFKFKIENLINNNYLNFNLILLVLFIFLLFRFPGIYNIGYFSVFLLVALFPYFISLFLSRVVYNWEEFFSSFTPVGAPIYIAPFVCLAEGISYLVRPFVLMLRPFLNLTIGAFGALSIGISLSGSFSIFLFFLFIFIFFYELFVCLVHWFIVTNILIFSIDH